MREMFPQPSGCLASNLPPFQLIVLLLAFIYCCSRLIIVVNGISKSGQGFPGSVLSVVSITFTSHFRGNNVKSTTIL